MATFRNELELGALLRSRRERAGLTQERLAERAGVSRAFVIDVERGRRPRAELHRVLALVRSLDAALDIVELGQESTDDILSDLLGEQ